MSCGFTYWPGKYTVFMYYNPLIRIVILKVCYQFSYVAYHNLADTLTDSQDANFLQMKKANPRFHQKKKMGNPL